MEDRYSLIIYAVFFASAIFFSFLINSLLYKFSRTMGVRNKDDGTIIRWGSQSKPAVGGISFFIVFLLSLTVYSVLFPTEHIFEKRAFIGFLLTINMGFLMGLADDAFNTRPYLKLVIQILCGVILVLSGIYIKIFAEDYLNYAITIFWVVGIMNSINMIDNMDAIATCVCIMIIASAMMVILLQSDFTNIYFVGMAGVLAALIGFLFHNWNPSKIYMGDTGSQFLGIFLAAIGILFFWNYKSSETIIPPFERFLIPLMVFMLPVIDTTIVVISRLSRGSSPFVGGKDHTTHALAKLGVSEQMVAIIYLLIGLLNMILLYIIIKFIPDFNILFWIIFGIYYLIVFSIFFYITKISKSKESASN